MKKSGKLFVVPTPIGNLKDITLRALEVLKSVDAIYCEDTRHSLKLLRAYQISKPLISLHEHNEHQRIKQVISDLLGGKEVALISDSGTPSISDPGFPLIRELTRQSLSVEVLPGPSALITGLVSSGLPTDAFKFLGFPPNRSAPRRRFLENIQGEKSTLILYESPHRIQKTLGEAHEILGDRPMALARELSKQFEEVYRGHLGDFSQGKGPRSWKGEFVLIIAGSE